MSSTYSENAKICTKFYQLAIDAESAARFAFENSKAMSNQDVLFVGGMFDIADGLKKLGLNITIVDYTEGMVELAKNRFPKDRVEIAKYLNSNQFEIVT